MSALISQALDKQLSAQPVQINGTLPQAIAQFADLTGVRIEADHSVYDVLPWGDLTTFNARLTNQTLRQGLTAICQKLGLQFELQDQAIELHPLPALRRLGRRCTIEELESLDLLAQTPLDPSALHPNAAKLLAHIDAKLQKTNEDLENRAFVDSNGPPISIARNATLLDALDEIPLQTDATWYPWGKTVVVLKKADCIRMQLSKRITTRFSGQDISSVLLELSNRSGVAFQIEPGAVQKIPPQFRNIRLSLYDATVQQALESIDGFTGLGYSVTDAGVRISYAAPPATQPAP
jgi:hypothetical protein